MVSTKDAPLLEAYNAAVLGLKEFRDAHLIIVTLYVIGPGRRAAREDAKGGLTGGKEPLKGSAGGDLAMLLKEFRDRTTGAVLPEKDSIQRVAAVALYCDVGDPVYCTFMTRVYITHRRGLPASISFEPANPIQI